MFATRTQSSTLLSAPFPSPKPSSCTPTQLRGSASVSISLNQEASRAAERSPDPKCPGRRQRSNPYSRSSPTTARRSRHPLALDLSSSDERSHFSGYTGAATAFYFRAKRHKLKVDRLRVIELCSTSESEFATVSNSMSELCFDVFGISKEKKDPNVVKGHRELLDALPCKRRREDDDDAFVYSSESESAPSKCRSIGSHRYPSDRLPKVSIGITVEKYPKEGIQEKSKDGIATLSCHVRNLSQENNVNEKKEPVIAMNSKQNGMLTAKDQNALAKLLTRCIPHERQSTETVHVFAEQTSVLDKRTEMPKNAASASKGDQACAPEKFPMWVPTNSPLQEPPMPQENLFEHQASIPKVENEIWKKAAASACENWLEKGANTERAAEAVESTINNEMHVLHKGNNGHEPDKVTKPKTEALKMKLWEILGMTSQNKQTMKSPNSEDKKKLKRNQLGMVAQCNPIMNSPIAGDKMTLKANQPREKLKGKSVKGKRNSDTIETDSEGPNEIIRRPLTRSMTQKKASSRTFQKSHKGIRYGKIPLSSSSSESKLLDNNIFTFDANEIKLVNSGQHVNSHPYKSKEKRSIQNKNRFGPTKIQLLKQLVSAEILKSTEREQTVPSPYKATSRTQERGPSCVAFEFDKDKLQTKKSLNHHLEPEENKQVDTPLVTSSAETREHCGSLKRKRFSWEPVKSPVLNDVHRENMIEHPSVEKTSIPSLVDLLSPTFDANPPTPGVNIPDEDLCPPAAAKKVTPSRTSSENHKDKTESADSETDSDEETREIHESENAMFPHETQATETSKLSPSRSHDRESFEASDFFNKGKRYSEELSLHSGSEYTESVGFYRIKRADCSEEKRKRKNSTSLPSHSGSSSSRTEGAAGAYEALEMYPEDTLDSAVCQLALVLRRFKTKIKSRVSKKSSQILSDVGEKVRLLLQHVETRLKVDLEKFLNSGKSREKCLESKFQEQQERLGLLHDKFKKEVAQHLLGCRNTLEEIEANKIELKGSLDRRKALHRKFLLQVEESIESQINHAEARVAALHNEANRKMIILKHMLKEWMVDDTTS